MQNCTPDFETTCNTLIIIAEWLQPRSKVAQHRRNAGRKDKGSQAGIGGEYVSNLLWALESLAWGPQYLGWVSIILAKLAARDPGGDTAIDQRTAYDKFFFCG